MESPVLGSALADGDLRSTRLRSHAVQRTAGDEDDPRHMSPTSEASLIGPSQHRRHRAPPSLHLPMSLTISGPSLAFCVASR